MLQVHHQAKRLGSAEPNVTDKNSTNELLDTEDVRGGYNLRSTSTALQKATHNTDNSSPRRRQPQAVNTTKKTRQSSLVQDQSREPTSPVSPFSLGSPVGKNSRRAYNLPTEEQSVVSEAISGGDNESDKDSRDSIALAGTRSSINSTTSLTETESQTRYGSNIRLADTESLDPAAAQFFVDPRPSADVDRSATLDTEILSRPVAGRASFCTRTVPSPPRGNHGPLSPVVVRPTPAVVSPNLALRNLSVKVVHCIITVQWLILETLLICQEVLGGNLAGARLILRSLTWIWLLPSLIVNLFSTLVFVGAIAVLAWFAVWSVGKSITAVDSLTGIACQVPWVGAICSYGCEKSPQLAFYVFPRTCSRYFSRDSHAAQPLWEESTNFPDDMTNIPMRLDAHEASCYYYKENFPSIRQGLAISEEDKDELAILYDEVCLYMRNISNDLPSYYGHVAIFSESLIQQVNLTRTHIQSTLANQTSQDLLVEQKIITADVQGIFSKWQQRHEFLEIPGTQVSETVREARAKAARLLHRLKIGRKGTMRARKNTIKKWNLLRRAGRAIGILRSEPEELHGFNDALEILDEWTIEARSLESLFTLISSNVTEVSRHFRHLTLTGFSADIQFQMGPGGLLDLSSYMMGVGSKAQGMRNAVQSARAITGETFSRQAEVEASQP